MKKLFIIFAVILLNSCAAAASSSQLSEDTFLISRSTNEFSDFKIDNCFKYKAALKTIREEAKFFVILNSKKRSNLGMNYSHSFEGNVIRFFEPSSYVKNGAIKVYKTKPENSVYFDARAIINSTDAQNC
tara:strand:- start:3634 stop:4023 length:390 start_codon:yes stop_codon:yes gene_type:complete